MGRLNDRVAVITGGSNGIGLATATRFIKEGAKVAIIDIDDRKGDELVKKLGANSKFFRLDVSNYTDVEKTMKEVFDSFGKIDILINNAGIARDASTKKMTIEMWQKVIDVNLSGAFYCVKAVRPYMAENNYGRIVSTSSVVALYGNFGQANYVAAKAGLIGMTKTWAREFGKDGITVNAVAPGFIDTEIIKTVPEEMIMAVKSKIPLRRIGLPDDISNAFLFLASDEASFITGTVLSVDGGLVF